MERGETQGFATGVWIDLINAHEYGNSSLACVDCPAGLACANDATSEPTTCPKGRFSVARSSACTLCAAGAVALEAGALAKLGGSRGATSWQ